jgi:hypothetical protein
VLADSSYGNKLDGGFGYDRVETGRKKPDNKRAAFTEVYADRLRRARIECRTAREAYEAVGDGSLRLFQRLPESRLKDGLSADRRCSGRGA